MRVLHVCPKLAECLFTNAPYGGLANAQTTQKDAFATIRISPKEYHTDMTDTNQS